MTTRLGLTGITRLALLSIVTVVLASSQATATVTMTAITGASTLPDGLNSSWLIINGGVAGPDCSHSAVAGQTCDNCVARAPGDAGLTACNNHRVYAGLQLKITLLSDRVVSGTPMITDSYAMTEKVIASGPHGIPKGTPVTLLVPWTAVCKEANLQNAGNPCDPVTLRLAQGIFDVLIQLNIGMSADGVSLSGARNDSVEVYFYIYQDIGQNGALGNRDQSLATNCDSTNPLGLCYYEMDLGGGVASLIRAIGAQGFPQYKMANLTAVRVLYSTTSFADISPASPHTDIQIPNGGIVLPSPILSSVAPHTTYYFKTAVIDTAGNVGLYTPAIEDGDCQGQPPSPSFSCHMVVSGH